jgi:hypothetical protein
MSYAMVRTPMYAACIRERSHDQRVLADLMLALEELATKPFDNPRLQTHAMKGVPGAQKTFISYVGNRGHRLIWRRLNELIVLLLFGEHDPIERRAERLDFEIDKETGGVRVVEISYEQRSAEPQTTPAGGPAARPGTLFMAWTDDELRTMGFTDIEVATLRVIDNDDELLALEDRMRPDGYQRALNLYLDLQPAGDEQVELRIDATTSGEHRKRIAEGVDPQERELERRVRLPASRETFDVVAREDFAEILAKPIEDWMVFLHPDQAKLTQRPFSGPARVRGAAGTGKTVVALHRARHLADIYGGRVLFTTFVRNLSEVYGRLFERLAPEDADSVEFRNLHSWAYNFVKRAGNPFRIDTNQINEAFWEAWRRTTRREPFLDVAGLDPSYYLQEIDWVIKGRGLERLDQYLQLTRSGRGTPLPELHRRHVWELFEEYQRQLARRDIVDFNDLLIRALALVDSGRLRERYAAVVIDEAQDLTEVGIRLAHAIAGGDTRDGLFLVGDGQQSVYPGGFSLGSIGIDIRGRSHVLRVNYRNTRQILNVANGVVYERPFDDLDDALSSGTRDVTVLRDGVAPVVEGFDSNDDHDEALVLAIQHAIEDPGVGPGDVAVLVSTNRLVDEYTKLIAGLGLATQKLQRYDGTSNDLIKVGTYQRAKGLEFKQVFLPRLDPDGIGETQRHHEDDQTHAERLDLLRRQLFVAMTRARDALWGGWVGQPTSLLRSSAAALAPLKRAG